MDQLAWSTFALAPGFPPCRNPVHPRLTPGGSSSGSAAAVAGDLAALGLGTDVAGSIRIPAACCGLVGLMPPPGWIPLDGGASFAPSFDCAGVLARSLRDCLTAVGVLAERPLPDPPPEPFHVGLLEHELERAHPDVTDAVLRAAGALRRAGIEVTPARLETPRASMSKVLATELMRTWGAEVKRAPGLYDDEVHESIAYARRLPAEAYPRALAELERGRREAEARLRGFTLVLGPTMRFPAPPADRPGTVADMTAATRPFNVLGWAALALPGGSDRPSRPVSVQLAAPPTNLGALVRVASLLSD
jgi:Asp-tRNA(Asn)/Glu-tRNA(Gln) amidotransferase A subunit family amidase